MPTKRKLTAKQKAFQRERAARGRQNNPLDIWSLVHFLTGVAMGLLFSPVVAVTLMVLWEPLEIFILSPLLARRAIDLGYEGLRNSLSDIGVDTAGVLCGHYLLVLIRALI